MGNRFGGGDGGGVKRKWRRERARFLSYIGPHPIRTSYSAQIRGLLFNFVLQSFSPPIEYRFSLSFSRAFIHIIYTPKYNGESVTPLNFNILIK